MNFDHSDDRKMLADTLQRYLLQQHTFATRQKIDQSATGWSRELWSALAELGVIGALIPEENGGFGGKGFDIAAVFEELGRALAVEPLLGTLLASRALTLAGGQDPLLEQIMTGSVIVAFAHAEPQNRYDLSDVVTRAERSGPASSWVLTGEKAVIPQLAAATHVLVTARLPVAESESGIGLFLVEARSPGIEIRSYPFIDGGRGGELSLAGAPAALIAEPGIEIVENAVAGGIVALVWEAIGVMDVLKSSTVEYLRTRKQFGVPIGKFQALAHRMATVALEIEQARSAAINAAAALESGRPERESAVSAAKYTIGRVGRLVAEEAIQMHGGIGMTLELSLSHYAKRLTMIDHQLGDEDHHLQRFAALTEAA